MEGFYWTAMKATHQKGKLSPKPAQTRIVLIKNASVKINVNGQLKHNLEIAGKTGQD
jgi:hypothetical protein